MQTRRQRCSQMETVSYRWKVTTFLPFLSLSVSLPSSSSFSLHFCTFSLLLLLPLPASDSISSLCTSLFSYFSPFHSMFHLTVIFYPPPHTHSFLSLPLAFTLGEEIGTLCYNPSVVTLMHVPEWLLYILPLFLPEFMPLSPLRSACTRTFTTQRHKCSLHSWPFSRLRNSQCIVGLDAWFVRARALWACVRGWQCKVKRKEAILVHTKTWYTAWL